MNIIELLMFEHASLRLHLRNIKEKNSDSIFDLHDFVENCHAKIEDEVVFPKLHEILAPKNEELNKVLSRLEADHKLIEMIGEQIKRSTTQGDERTMRKRIMLYADTLESHNSSEESLIFPLWHLDVAEERYVMLQATKIIEKFGRDRYFRITGVSQKFYEVATKGEELTL
jgi:hemerythrin superfamily protein